MKITNMYTIVQEQIVKELLLVMLWQILLTECDPLLIGGMIVLSTYNEDKFVIYNIE